MSDGYQILSLDELEPATLGFQPANVNGRRADTGGRLIPPEEDDGHEKLYAVVRGRVRFRVGEEEADAPAGTLVFVPPNVVRTAVSTEDATMVFVVAGNGGRAVRRDRQERGHGMNLVHLDDLDAIEMPEGFVWRPVRRRFGIKAFGTNAYTPGASGQIVEEHTEEQLGHQEIYLVLRGRVRFAIGGDEHELGPGELVFVRDPSLRRGGVALTDDAAVLAVGGKPDDPHEISAWEYVFAASPHVQAGRWDEAERVMHEGLDEKPGDAALLYNLACLEARAGKPDAALDHLLTAVRANERFREYAQTDEDFTSIRDDPRFPR